MVPLHTATLYLNRTQRELLARLSLPSLILFCSYKLHSYAESSADWVNMWCLYKIVYKIYIIEFLWSFSVLSMSKLNWQFNFIKLFVSCQYILKWGLLMISWDQTKQAHSAQLFPDNIICNWFAFFCGWDQSLLKTWSSCALHKYFL